MTRKFADNPKKDKFIKDCIEMAQSILGDAYNEDVTVKTAEGIWKDHANEDYDAKCSIFRNGLKPFSDNKRTFSITRDNTDNYGQLIGTLLQSAVIAHLYHFQTKCRWCHADMEDFYNEIVDLTDDLCEAILEPISIDLLYQNVIDQTDTPTEYFEALKAYCQDMKSMLFSDFADSNYASMMDDIIDLISKTLYRLKRFSYYKEMTPDTKEIIATNYSKRTFSEFNGVKDAPQLFAVIFLPKGEHSKLDCNASYKEADEDAVECFVPDGGYGLIDPKMYLEALRANHQDPQGVDCKCEIVPAAKVKIHGRIGHSSSSL